MKKLIILIFIICTFAFSSENSNCYFKENKTDPSGHNFDVYSCNSPSTYSNLDSLTVLINPSLKKLVTIGYEKSGNIREQSFSKYNDNTFLCDFEKDDLGYTILNSCDEAADDILEIYQDLRKKLNFIKP